MIKKVLLYVFLFFAGTLAFSQGTVSGTVYLDTDDEVAIGATVRVKGTNTGAITDLNGQYTLEASQDDVLVASFVGYATQEQAVNGSTADFYLESSNLLDGIVVTAFGIEKEDKSLGYSVQEVSTESINLDGQVNAFESLQGRVSGLQINKTSGGAGSGFDITLRGVTSVNPGRSNQPLIIVDGVAINNDTFAGNVLPSEGSNSPGSSEQFGFTNRAADINPQDIESFSVLKGAAATALYGIRASNGAIIITTKRGTQGKAKIGLSLSTSFNDVSKMPTLQSTYREGHRTTKIPTVDDPNSPSGFYRPAGFTFYTWGVPYTDDSFTLDSGEVIDLSNDRFYNPYEDFFDTGSNSQVNFNISGADERLDYFFSAGTSNDKGIVPNTDYDKLNFRFKGGLKANEKFKINTSLAYTKSGGARGTGGDKSIMSTLSYWATSFDVNDYLLPNGNQKNVSSFSDNPRYFAETSVLEDDVNRWIGGTGFVWDPLDKINITYNVQMDNYSDKRNRFVRPDLDVGSQVGGFVIDQNIDYNGVESNLLGRYTDKFSDDVGFFVLLGNQVNTTRSEFELQRGEGLFVADINSLDNAGTHFYDKGLARERTVGFFGEVGFDIKEQLYLNFTGRNDNVSTLPQDNRSFFYPSASLSYLFADKLDPNGEVLSFGKFRTSWAKVGKGANFGDVGEYFISDPSFPIDGVGGYRYNSVSGDINLKPEFTSSWEIGTDLRFLDNRLRVDYSFYNAKTEDQILTVGTAYTSGLSGYTRNAGDYKTWGHEFLASYDLLDSKDFEWNSTLNFSTTKGEVTALPSDLDDVVYYSDGFVSSRARVGDAVGDLYGWVYQTVPSGERYVAPNGYHVVTGSENEGFWSNGINQQVNVGNALPDFIMSLGNNLDYKDFSLNFLMEWKKGGQLYDTGLRNAIRNGNLAITELRDEEIVLDGMMDDGNGGYETNTTPALISANSYYRSPIRYYAASEEIVRDADWLKLRQISLGYALPSTLANKIQMQSASVDVAANNIILWTPWDGFDPEGSIFSAGSNIYGFTGTNIPLTQRFSLGLNFNF